MSAEALHYEDFDAPPAASLLAVDNGLDLYNHATAPVADVRPLASFATDGAGRVVGGAVGRTWGECCELLQLWVDSEHRALGVGSRLVQRFELSAAQRGCRTFYLTTLSFQAPEFYRKHGYTAVAEISGYPNRIRKYLMYKEAPPADPLRLDREDAEA